MELPTAYEIGYMIGSNAHFLVLLAAAILFRNFLYLTLIDCYFAVTAILDSRKETETSEEESSEDSVIVEPQVELPSLPESIDYSQYEEPAFIRRGISVRV